MTQRQEEKYARPRPHRHIWLARRGDGGSMGRTLRKRERFIHVSQEYDATFDDDGKITGYEPRYVGPSGRARGITYVKPQEGEQA